LQKIILYLFFSCNIFLAAAQISIKGRVLDGKTGLPVVNASVYLNNTSIGTVTNADGGFTFSTKSLFTGELIVSSVGYQTLSYKLANNSINNFYTFKLDIKENTLMNILVMTDPQRREWLNIFKENFLGITEEADNCKIENPEAIYFAAGENKNSLYAYADTALVITNKLMGYTISFDLIEFSYDKVKNSTYFIGYSRYQEMGEKKRWIKKRKQNYFGSTMHFYRSLIADHLKADGYTIFNVQRGATKKSTLADTATGPLMALPTTSVNVLEKDSVNHLLYLHGFRQLMVQYNETPHSRYYLSSKVLVRGLTRFGFTGYISLLTDKAELDENGIIHSPLQIVYDGFWVYEKLANQLPFDYQPE
jgi:hypothetical protein